MAKLEELELEVDAPSRMIVLDAVTSLPMKDRDGKEAYVEVYSSDSDIARRFKREIRTSRLRMRNPNGLNGQKIEDEEVQLLAALTAGWYLVNRSGEPIDLPFTPENALKLYANNKMAWLADQVNEHAAARANFSKAASGNS